MGRESRVRRSRTCRECGKPFDQRADGMMEHANTCKRLHNLGLIPPPTVEGIQRDVSLIKLK